MFYIFKSLFIYILGFGATFLGAITQPPYKIILWYTTGAPLRKSLFLIFGIPTICHLQFVNWPLRFSMIFIDFCWFSKAQNGQNSPFFPPTTEWILLIFANFVNFYIFWPFLYIFDRLFSIFSILCYFSPIFTHFYQILTIFGQVLTSVTQVFTFFGIFWPCLDLFLAIFG